MPNPTPKPVALVAGHRTKAEKEIREAGEKALKTKQCFREWPTTKENPIAHKHFARIKKLLKEINKDDALFEAGLNRYCVMLAECEEYKIISDRLNETLEELEDKEDEFDKWKDYIALLCNVSKQLQDNDKLLQSKRKMLLDIEKENLMTISGQTRAIQKKPAGDEDDDPMNSLGWRRANV